MPIGQPAQPWRKRAFIVAATAVFVSGVGAMDRLYADDLSPVMAGQIAASSQRVADVVRDGWRGADSLAGPLFGRYPRLQFARYAGVLEQALGAGGPAGEAWLAVVGHAKALGNLPRLIEALDRSVALALARGDYDSASTLAAELLLHARRNGLVREQAAVRADLARIGSMWTELLAAHGGPLLFGDFSIADAYFAPVASRS